MPSLKRKHFPRKVKRRIIELAKKQSRLIKILVSDGELIIKIPKSRKTAQ